MLSGEEEGGGGGWNRNTSGGGFATQFTTIMTFITAPLRVKII